MKKGASGVIISIIVIIIVIIIILSQFDITGDIINPFKRKVKTPPAPITDGTGLNAYYYDNKDLTNLKLSRIDPNVNYNYGSGSPDPSITDDDTFSIRWEGYVIPSYTELYTFYTYSNDGMRIYVNNQLIVSDWTNHAAQEKSGTIALQAGISYPIKIEYYQDGGTALVQASWSSPAQAKQVIPQSALRSSPVDDGLPIVSITSPLANSIVSLPFTVNADASDSDGIKEVNFYTYDAYFNGTDYDFTGAKGLFLNDDNTPPYSYEINLNYPFDKGINGYQNIFAIAYDTLGNKKRSDPIVFYVEDYNQIPSKLYNFKATPLSSSSIQLTWNDSYGERGYTLNRSLSELSGFVEIATLPQNSVTYTDTNLNDNTVYYYRLRANNTQYSKEAWASGKTLPIFQPICSKPDETNTGPSNPSILQTYTGPLTITTPGTVIQNAIINGQITIQADNVIIRNFRIFADGNYYGIRATNGNNGILIENGEIIGAGISGQIFGAGIYGEGLTARRVNIHDSKGDGIKPIRNVRVENSWAHHLGTELVATDGHADVVQIRKGNNFTFICNNFDLPKGLDGHKSNAVFMIQTAEGTIGDILIDNNWINGGNIVFQAIDNGFGAPTNVRIINNLWGKDCQYGLFTGSVDEWTNNRWEDTQQLISLTEARNTNNPNCKF